jgi:hypothetical protein
MVPLVDPAVTLCIALSALLKAATMLESNSVSVILPALIEAVT